ncbi:MAG: hypothetical protein MHMPM18_004489 [Marteilia pararefringens]
MTCTGNYFAYKDESLFSLNSSSKHHMLNNQELSSEIEDRGEENSQAPMMPDSEEGLRQSNDTVDFSAPNKYDNYNNNNNNENLVNNNPDHESAQEKVKNRSSTSGDSANVSSILDIPV